MKRSRYNKNEESLRDLLRDKRLQRGLTQKALASALGRPQSFISKYEGGERLLSFVETISVCDALKIRPCELLKEYMQHHDAR